MMQRSVTVNRNWAGLRGRQRPSMNSRMAAYPSGDCRWNGGGEKDRNSGCSASSFNRSLRVGPLAATFERGCFGASLVSAVLAFSCLGAVRAASCHSGFSSFTLGPVPWPAGGAGGDEAVAAGAGAGAGAGAFEESGAASTGFWAVAGPGVGLSGT